MSQMNLTAEEQALRAGEYGPAAQWAIEHQIKVGEYLGAGDFVPGVCAIGGLSRHGSRKHSI